MLNRLAEYASTKGLSSKPGFGHAEIHWILDLDNSGSPSDLRRAKITSSSRPDPWQYDQAPITPANVLNAGGKSHFLWESAAVLLNWPKDGGDQKAAGKIQQKHGFFVRLIQEASAVDSSLQPIVAFYQNPAFVEKARKLAETENAKREENITFAVCDKVVLQTTKWRDWWSGRSSLFRNAPPPAPGAVAASKPSLLDFLTSEPCEPESSHPTIRGLIGIGGQAKTRLISYDKEAFESYGFMASANCAMSAESASLYTSVLQHLINDRDRCSRLGNSFILHWFDAEVQKSEDLFSFLLDPPETAEITALQRMRDLVAAVRTGSQPNLAGSRFFVLVIAASGGRIVVRRWLEGAFEELADNVARWFDDLSIATPYLGGRITSSFRLGTLANSSWAQTRSNTDTADKQLALNSELLLNSALLGLPLPHSFVQSVLARIALDAVSSPGAGDASRSSPLPWRISHSPERMAILKLFLVRNQQRRTSCSMSDIQPSLDVQQPDPAYHCGRLMAVLAGIQQAALGDVGAGVVERYYAAASSTPALVFGRLVRGAQPHLSSLSPGLAWYYQELLAQIARSIGNQIPTTLSLEQQSLFALGYYHQWLDLRTKRDRSQQDADSETSNVNMKENN